MTKEEKKGMVYEKPILNRLDDESSAFGDCTPAGAADLGACTAAGASAGSSCAVGGGVA